ncbi:30S ribosomal protein S19e [Halalkalicoccus paucihalophilus]|jgi:small subunit ribosomal protein S19e|uniref:Small ribosomal subunit protein eS19 n=1 Tax=Halalkalicoccus paucihalophilus TaxID=1008153 RepID=A0A151AF02_9EURY|nr:30S ribosomal protein S19e [Halalkalicoccus paucihalophilus]KYH26155.1 30S ribosomal protein S19e [Halalkalicoccus paucihalophilus]
MTTLYDVPADELIEALSDRLADRIDQPDWAAYAKTGASRELPPEREDFWTVRAASLLRRVAIDGPVGVERLATHYGSAKRGSNRYTVAPPKQTDGSDNVIRTILQQLEDEGLVSQQGDAGRIATAEGRSLLDEVAGEVLSSLAEDRPELERYA